MIKFPEMFRNLMLITLKLFSFSYCYDYIRPCKPDDIFPCSGANQICDSQSSQCICKKNYEFNLDGVCVPFTPESGGNVVLILFVIFLTLCLMCCGLYLIEHRYNIVQHVRRRIEQSRNTSVSYEDVNIGNDDPPIDP